ncbi:hypothetical protein BKD30_08330 [Tersicoccus phoenicis]|uniref:Antitoxin Xre/MbcA/ParS-like toxin-binding domain-containing protein n=1 Tax=Tersicoccus phoenicis TaxID=554083 RepID=A0A1R1LAM5_9MICC|nr:hypothetical protein [Tersicoccus phoenicis]OMH24582.1 hypothetical protein BKD30_08330 [Tersicoccus phoenicis]
MSMISVGQAYRETSRMDIHTVARELNEALGPTLVAVLAGVRDRKLPGKWAKPDGVSPRHESERRLKTAHRVWRSLSQSTDAHIARSWFISLNPLLDETAPVEALNAGMDRAVLEAAAAYLADAHDI